MKKSTLSILITEKKHIRLEKNRSAQITITTLYNTTQNFTHNNKMGKIQLAKRQLTWLRNWPEINWLNMEDEDNLQQILSRISKL